MDYDILKDYIKYKLDLINNMERKLMLIDEIYVTYYDIELNLNHSDLLFVFSVLGYLNPTSPDGTSVNYYSSYSYSNLYMRSCETMSDIITMIEFVEMGSVEIWYDHIYKQENNCKKIIFKCPLMIHHQYITIVCKGACFIRGIFTGRDFIDKNVEKIQKSYKNKKIIYNRYVDTIYIDLQ